MSEGNQNKESSSTILQSKHVCKGLISFGLGEILSCYGFRHIEILPSWRRRKGIRLNKTNLPGRCVGRVESMNNVVVIPSSSSLKGPRCSLGWSDNMQ